MAMLLRAITEGKEGERRKWVALGTPVQGMGTPNGEGEEVWDGVRS